MKSLICPKFNETDMILSFLIYFTKFLLAMLTTFPSKSGMNFFK